ncbi:protein TonB [Lysobacter niabensis]|uniref:Protein TonB n=1 Tax=Agrilutibacter niabensis TaxID=380628 RepID=A0ABU1VP47_9GAMM|nr:TonB family protein [Lysobacter niabensis]MDR7099256.1 protein TonB [Lysobacter niabensis]
MAQTLALHTHRFQIGKLDFARLDFTRISAEAGAIAINGAALLLLLAPLSMYVPPAAERDTIEIFPVIREKLPDPPRPPEKVEVTTPRIVPTTPTVVPQKMEVQPPVVDAQEGDIAIEPMQVAKLDVGLGDTTSQPLAGAHLEYETAPPPRYPIEAIRESLTGTVTLRVLVDVDGRPIDVQVERSSGHRVLDAAAKKQVLAKWRFRPAMQDGQAVQAIGLIPVEFNLNQ